MQNTEATSPGELQLKKYESHMSSFQHSERKGRNDSMSRTIEPVTSRVYAKRHSMGAP